MFVMNNTDNFNDFINCRDNKKEDNVVIIKYLHPSLPSSILLLCPINLIIYKMIKPLVNNK